MRVRIRFTSTGVAAMVGGIVLALLLGAGVISISGGRHDRPASACWLKDAALDSTVTGARCVPGSLSQREGGIMVCKRADDPQDSGDLVYFSDARCMNSAGAMTGGELRTDGS